MTDEDLLAEIEQGYWRLSGDKVERYHKAWKRWIVKKFDEHPESGRLRCRIGKSRRTVYKNKLVWMIVNRQVVPDGHVVDHANTDRCNDTPENLQLMTRRDSDRQGYLATRDAKEQECHDYFDAIIFLGHEPRWSLSQEEVSDE